MRCPPASLRVSEEVAEREERDNRTGSLMSVINVIPGAAYEYPTWRGMPYFARDLVIYLGAIVAPVV